MKYKNDCSFDEKLFLDIAKEAKTEIIDGPGNDIVDNMEVDVISVLFECIDIIKKEVEE